MSNTAGEKAVEALRYMGRVMNVTTNVTKVVDYEDNNVNDAINQGKGCARSQ